MKLLWVIDSGRAPIYLFGGGPPPRWRWSDPEIEALVRESDEFWNEAPEIDEADRALAVKYGVDSERPLATWVDAADMERVERAATDKDVSMDLLRAVRPWLAAQLLKMAFESKAGPLAENSAEVVLANVAKDAGVAVHSEMGSPEGAFALFAGLSREAEVDRLRSTLDDIEAGADAFVRDAEAVARGDEGVGERLVERMRSGYPALYEPLLVRRNRAWVGRIEAMLREGTRAFIAVGSAHLAGGDSVQVMLAEAGIAVRRV
jgi:uncharacterized protein YbaP (TraB family)